MLNQKLVVDQIVVLVHLVQLVQLVQFTILKVHVIFGSIVIPCDPSLIQDVHSCRFREPISIESRCLIASVRFRLFHPFSSVLAHSADVEMVHSFRKFKSQIASF